MTCLFDGAPRPCSRLCQSCRAGCSCRSPAAHRHASAALSDFVRPQDGPELKLKRLVNHQTHALSDLSADTVARYAALLQPKP